MTHRELARGLLAGFCALQGVATIALDMNRTHASNPVWLRHARFHVVWQTGIVAVLAVMEIVLLYSTHPLPSERFYLVVVLTSVPVAAFFAALVTRRIYGGALSDPNGIPPLRIQYRRAIWRFDMSLVAEVIAVLVLAYVVWIYRR